MNHSRALLGTLLATLASAVVYAEVPKQPDNLPKEIVPAFKVWANKCSACHNAERVYGTKYTDTRQITLLVARMARKTSTISKDDQKKIVAYITWHNKPSK